MQNSVCFLGAGNMGEALIKGYLNVVPANKIAFLENNNERASYINTTYNIKNLENISEINNYDVLIVALKPQSIPDVMPALSKDIKKSVIIISIVAGVSINYYQKYFSENKILRVMPNTPCLINKGISGISSSPKCSSKDIEIAKAIFGTTGKVIVIDEKKIDAVTALSGSGPAYFYHIADTYAKAAAAIGMDYDTALSLVTNTMLGSAEMILNSEHCPSELISKVKSPGGTTAAALEKLQVPELEAIIKNSIIAAENRAKELNLKE